MEIEGTQHRQNNLAKEQYIVLALWFQSRIWFELIFVCGVSQGVYSFAYGFRLSWVCEFPESWWFYQLKLHNVWKLNQVQCLNSYFGLDVQISESRVSLAPRMIVGLRVLPRVSLWRHGTELGMLTRMELSCRNASKLNKVVLWLCHDPVLLSILFTYIDMYWRSPS